MIDRNTYPWLVALRDTPTQAVEDLLRGYAYLPLLQRATPSEALRVIMGDIEEGAKEWGILDSALLEVLQNRENARDSDLDRPGGIAQYIFETSEAIRVSWLLPHFPKTIAWLTDNPFKHIQWAKEFPVLPGYDLEAALLTALARVQKDEQLKFIWYRFCRDASQFDRFHRLDVGLLGLAKMGRKKDNGFDHSKKILGGFAHWASHLPDNRQKYKSRVEQVWSTLKASLPHTPGFWYEQFLQLDSAETRPPYLEWLKDADKSLVNPPVKNVKRPPILPKNIPGIIDDFKAKIARDGLTAENLAPIKNLIDLIETYAEYSGNSSDLSKSCNSIASLVAGPAPHFGLSLIQRAQQWDLSDGYLWSTRSKILVRLGHSNLARSVLWEGWRRCPTNAALPLALGLLTARVEDYDLALKLLNRTSIISKATNDQKGIFGALTYSAQIHGIMGNRDAGIAAVNQAMEIQKDKLTDMLIEELNNGKEGQEKLIFELTKPNLMKNTSQLAWDLDWKELVVAKEGASEPQLETIGILMGIEFKTAENSLDDKQSGYMDMIDQAIENKQSKGLAYFLKARLDIEFASELPSLLSFKNSLPLQLSVPKPDFETLSKNYFERAYLIHLVNFNDNQDMKSRGYLLDWARRPLPTDSDWRSSLKKQLLLNLDRPAEAAAETIISVSDLKRASLLEEIELDPIEVSMVA